MKKYFYLLFIIINACSQDKKEKQIQPKEVVEYPYERKQLSLKNIYDVIKEKETESLEDFSLNGKVKKVIIKTYHKRKPELDIDVTKYQLTNSNRGFENYPVSFNFNLEVSFDENGNMLKSIGEEEIQENKYNDSNNIISKEFIEFRKTEKKDTVRLETSKDTYIYDENNYLLEGISENNKKKKKYNYFPKKNQIEILDFEDEEIIYSEVITYNEFGLPIKDKNKKGDLWTYEYNKFGEIVNAHHFSSDGDSYDYPNYMKIDKNMKVYRLFDKHNNCIERYVVVYGNPLLESNKKNNVTKVIVTKLNIEYYSE